MVDSSFILARVPRSTHREHALVAECDQLTLRILGCIKFLRPNLLQLLRAGGGEQRREQAEGQRWEAARGLAIDGLRLEPQLRDLLVVVTQLDTDGDILVAILVFDKLAMGEATDTKTNVISNVEPRERNGLLQATSIAKGLLQLEITQSSSALAPTVGVFKGSDAEKRAPGFDASGQPIRGRPLAQNRHRFRRGSLGLQLVLPLPQRCIRPVTPLHSNSAGKVRLRHRVKRHA
mmetsp:Transcript_12548/g.44443  ORF Transcript_12548/g.44443 Transcript_12548/m.44443 type:complete len:234 (-) Transcript_12548:3087-3788(-)